MLYFAPLLRCFLPLICYRHVYVTGRRLRSPYEHAARRALFTSLYAITLVDCRARDATLYALRARAACKSTRASGERRSLRQRKSVKYAGSA